MHWVLMNKTSIYQGGGKILHFALEKGIEERLRLYGQKDHVRLYGNDSKHRLENMGFKVTKFTVKDDVLQEEAVRMNLIAEGSVWVLEKRQTGPENRSVSCCRIDIRGVHMCRESKNIMYIFNDSSFGGAGQSLLDTLDKIRDCINPIVIIRDDVDVADKFNKLGIQCYKINFATDYIKIGSIDKANQLKDIKQNYEAALQLLPIIQKESIQLIHINSSISSFAAIAALMAHIPYVWHIRELLQEHFRWEFINEDLKIALFKRADMLIAISDYVKQSYLKKYHMETYRLYNGFNINRYKSELSNKSSFDNTFIVAAMITPEKGQWDVMRATELLVKRGYEDVKVTIVGAGGIGYIWALKKYINRKKLDRNIRILPFQDDLSQLRKQSSYAITSSQNEALGRVTIEAMLAGNLVIGARSGATTEIIGTNEERGFLYELGDYRSLADTMEKAMNCVGSKKDIILKSAQEYAQNTFNSECYCETLLDVYDEVVGSYKPSEDDTILSALGDFYNAIGDTVNCKIKDKNIPYKKSAQMFPVALKWLEIRQQGQSLDKYFKVHDIQIIAIYGMGALGCRLYDELEDSNVTVKYLIDKNPNGMDQFYEFSKLEEKLDVDAVVVTVISAEGQIVNEIREYGYQKVIGLSEILNSYDNKWECEKESLT